MLRLDERHMLPANKSVEFVFDAVLLLCIGNGLRPEVSDIRWRAAKLEWNQVVDVVRGMPYARVIDETTAPLENTVPVICLFPKSSPQAAPRPYSLGVA